jgi:hypothetical protein
MNNSMYPAEKDRDTYVRLRSSDGHMFVVPIAAIRESATLSALVEGHFHTKAVIRAPGVAKQ